MSEPDLRAKILNYFTAELPRNVRVVNLPSLVAEIEGEGCLDEEGYVPESLEDAYLAGLKPLVEEDVLQVGEVLGCEVFGLTIAAQDRWKAEGSL